MDKYSALMEYLLDCRALRLPSWEDMVFCLETGWKDDEEAVEARDGVCNMTDIASRGARRLGYCPHSNQLKIRSQSLAGCFILFYFDRLSRVELWL